VRLSWLIGAAIFLFLVLMAIAYGAEVPISSLPAATTPTGAELTACVQGGTTKKCTIDQTDTYTFSRISQDCTATSTGVATCLKTNNVAFGTLATLSAAPAGTLTGTTLASNVVTSSLTSLGTLTGGATGAGFTLALSTSTLTGILPVANGGNGTATPALTDGVGTNVVGTWPAQSVNAASTNYGTSLYYAPVGITTNGAAATPGANIIQCTKGVVERKLTITNIGYRVQSADATGSAQFAIYDNSSGRPGNLIRATGSIATTPATTNLSGALSATTQVGPGGSDAGSALWWCFNTNSATLGTLVVRGGSGGMSASYIGSTLVNISTSSTSITSVSCAGANCNGGSSTFNTWPSSLAGSTWTEQITPLMPMVFFDVTSIP